MSFKKPMIIVEDDPDPGSSGFSQSAFLIVAVLAFLIFSAEAVVMFIISRLPPFSTVWGEAIFDSSLLMLFISPTLYYLCFRPLFIHIRAQRKLELELREAVKVKSYFTSMVSHELRTPLSAIKESIAVVSDGIVGPVTDAQKDCLKICERNVERLTRLINEILDFQKIEEGRVSFDFQEQDLNDLIREVKNTMAPLAEKHGLEFRLNLQEDLPKVVLDRDKVIQTLTNLVGNAVKFTKEGNITVATRRTNGAVLVAVQDTGCGIRKEDIAKLFQKFSQLGGEERLSEGGGTGLGLVISKEIVERHHGRIWAESVFGKGSVFYFSLPIRQAEVKAL